MLLYEDLRAKVTPHPAEKQNYPIRDCANCWVRRHITPDHAFSA